ncbi:MAG: TolC family protein [Desulfobacterales bacterium]|nr:TolC family protein [Desulfobacterales bacterium]
MKYCRRVVLGVVCLVLFAGVAVQAKSFRIGTVSDGISERFPGTLELVKEEIINLTRGAHPVVFPENSQLSGNWDKEGVNRALDALLSSRNVDLVITLGVVSTHEVCRRNKLPKPVIAADVIDAKTQQLPADKGSSGVVNLNYINTFADIDRAFQSFLDISPFYRVVILADGFHMRSIPQLRKLERRLANEFSLDMKVIPVETAAADALAKIPADTEAVFVSRLPRLSNTEFDALVSGLNQRRLPSFAFSGRRDVEKGLLTSIIPSDDLQHMARSVAINVQDLLDGTRAGDLQTTFPLSEKLSINMATARTIGVYPGWSILTEADLLHEEDKAVDRTLDMRSAVADALKANPDLAVADRTVLAGREAVLEARSALYPQISVGSDARVIDDDRAKAGSGSAPEREWTGTITATQLIYSDSVWANYDIARYLQISREQDREAVALDIIQSAATAYLNVLRAKSIEQIQKNNLKLTRENLERAQIRVSIGAAGPEEVYRWENQIAESRRDVLTAESAVLDAMSSLNNVLNRPLRESFGVQEGEYQDPMGILPDRKMLAYMDNPQELNALRDFLVEEGLALSPELKQLDASIAAQERSIVLAKREFWLPSVALSGDVTQSFSDGGEGVPTSIYPDDDTNWTAGITLSLPLYSGGGKSATLRRNLEELSGLKYQKRSTANTIEQQVLSAVYLIRASYPGIRLTLHAADSARRNLTLVTDSYARGIKSIIDLIDAQSSALVADQQAANAVYNFLIDMMAVQRSLGSFFLFAPEAERSAFMDRLNQYMVAKGFGRE